MGDETMAERFSVSAGGGGFLGFGCLEGSSLSMGGGRRLVVLRVRCIGGGGGGGGGGVGFGCPAGRRE